MNKIKIALIGVGSCASSLVQELDSKRESGIMFKHIGKYLVEDIEAVCALDVNEKKVGIPLRKAIFENINKAVQHVKVKKCDKDIIVEAGILFDGLRGYLSKYIRPHMNVDQDINRVKQILKKSGAEVAICMLPTGSSRDVEEYALICAELGIAFINCTPEKICRNKTLVHKFLDNRVPLLGDDLRSHFGATTLHTILIEALLERGIEIKDTYQLNVGGNMDFLNLSSPERSKNKHESKKNALNAAGIDASEVAAGPNGYIKCLGDTKVCYLYIRGKSILESDISLDVKLTVEDSPNAVGVINTAIRIAKLALDKNISGALSSVNAFMFKSPDKPISSRMAYDNIKEFVMNYADSES